MREKFARLYVIYFNILIVNILRIHTANIGPPVKPCI